MTVSRRTLLLGPVAAVAANAQFSPRPEEIPPQAPLPADRLPDPLRGASWKAVYHFDEADTTFNIVALEFASSDTGYAAGRLLRNGRTRENRLLVTRDGGATWKPVKLGDTPVSLSTLGEGHLWVVTTKNVLYSSDAGATWDKRKLPKQTLRVCFANENAGFAFGAGKVFWRTADGGRNWQKVAESEQLQLTDANTSYSAMRFVTPQVGVLVGNSRRPDLDEEYLPDWMLPERAARRRARPATAVTWTTSDGGATWKSSVASVFGTVSQIRLEGGLGASIFFYGDGFVWPSEVVTIDLSTADSKPAFRRSDLRVTDLLIQRNSGVFLGAISPLGRLTSAGLPGKVKILFSPDLKQWFQMKVDYRAEGAHVMLASDGGKRCWAATENGMILRLDH